MGEAIITRGCYGGGSNWDQGTLAPTTGLFVANTDYICTRTGNYLITCLGGGGKSGYPNYANSSQYWSGGGGGSGYVNQGTIFLNNGEIVPITLGNGSTTSFGTHIAANPGSSANTWIGGTGYNNGKNGYNKSTSAYNYVANGGVLYRNSINHAMISNTNTGSYDTELEYGYGAKGGGLNRLSNGSVTTTLGVNVGGSGYVSIYYLD